VGGVTAAHTIIKRIPMNNTQLSELAFELLRIHLGKHDVPVDENGLRLALGDEFAVCRSILPRLTDKGIDAVNLMITALSEGMVSR